MDERNEMRYIHLLEEMRQFEEHPSEDQLDRAIRKGMDQGIKKRRQVIYLRRLGFISAVIASILLLAAVGQLEPPAQQGTEAVLGSSGVQIPDYVETMMTPDMKTAADHGLYQPINRVVEQDGYRVSIDGALADRRKLIVFVRADNLSENGAKPDLNFEFLGPDGKAMDLYYSTSSLSTDSDPPKQTKHISYTLSFFGGSTPDQYIFSGQIGKNQGSDRSLNTIQIPFQIDNNKYAELERIIPIDQSVTIGGKKITMKEMILTPLNTKIRIESDYTSGNRNLQQIKNARLYLGETKQDPLFYRQSEFSIMSGKTTLSALHFDSLYYSDWNEATLKASGLAESTYSEKKVAINTETKQVVTPDSLIQLEDVIPREDSTEIRLQYERKRSDDAIPYELQNYFSENGNAQFAFKEGVSINYSSSGSKDTIRFFLEQKKYHQPLTFTFTSTLKHDIDQPLEVLIPMKK